MGSLIVLDWYCMPGHEEQPKGVILLAYKQIHKFTEEQSPTFFAGWCLQCFFGFLFVGTQTTNAQIRKYTDNLGCVLG